MKFAVLAALLGISTSVDVDKRPRRHSLAQLEDNPPGAKNTALAVPTPTALSEKPKSGKTIKQKLADAEEKAQKQMAKAEAAKKIAELEEQKAKYATSKVGKYREKAELKGMVHAQEIVKTGDDAKKAEEAKKAAEAAKKPEEKKVEEVKKVVEVKQEESKAAAAPPSNKAAKKKKDGDTSDSTDSTDEQATNFIKGKEYKAQKRKNNPVLKARFNYARDRCKHKKESSKKDCFIRNWRLYKPDRRNTLKDFRARTHRACWKYRKDVDQMNHCFNKYIKEYEDELHKTLLYEKYDEVRKLKNSLAEEIADEARAHESKPTAVVQ